MVNLCTPLIDDGETVRVSMLSFRRVNMIEIWLSRPTRFSENTATVYKVLEIVIVGVGFLSVFLSAAEQDVVEYASGRNHWINEFFGSDVDVDEVGAVVL